MRMHVPAVTWDAVLLRPLASLSFDGPAGSGARRAGARCRRGAGRNAQGRGDRGLSTLHGFHSHAVQSRCPVGSRTQVHRRWGRGGYCEGARAQPHRDIGLCASSGSCVVAAHVARTLIVYISRFRCAPAPLVVASSSNSVTMGLAKRVRRRWRMRSWPTAR